VTDRLPSVHPNDLWQAHTELAVMVLDETGKPARPWLKVILDDHSWAVAGYTVFLGDPSAMQTALASRQAIWRKQDPAWPVCRVSRQVAPFLRISCTLGVGPVVMTGSG